MSLHFQYYFLEPQPDWFNIHTAYITELIKFSLEQLGAPFIIFLVGIAINAMAAVAFMREYSILPIDIMKTFATKFCTRGPGYCLYKRGCFDSKILDTPYVSIKI